MNYLRRAVTEMTGYVPGEQPSGEGWIKLNQNENPYPPSSKAIEAMRNMVHNVGHYPETSSRGVRVAAAELYGVDLDEVMVSNGSDEMLRILFQACVGEGERVVAFYPSYTYYETLARIQGAEYDLVDFNEDYSLPDGLNLSGAKLVFLPNPNAPSGTVFSPGDIDRLCMSAVDGLVVVDEAYADFYGETAIGLINKYDNIFITRTFSKSYSLAGLRVGLGFGSKALLAQLDKVRDFYNVDLVAQAGAKAALRDNEYFRDNTSKIVATRERLIVELDQLANYVWPSRANFVLARFTSPSAAEVFAKLRSMKVLVRHFKSRRLDDCLRISVGTDEEIDRFLDALKIVLAG